jgi:hypothetical protein
VVPGEGIEPTLCRQNRILSPARLPVPPSRRLDQTEVYVKPRAAFPNMRGVHASDFDFQLPAELIAQRPLAERTASRLLVLDTGAASRENRTFRAGRCLDPRLFGLGSAR